MKGWQKERQKTEKNRDDGKTKTERARDKKQILPMLCALPS